MAVDEHQRAGIQENGPAACRVGDVNIPQVDRVAGQLAEIVNDDAARLLIGVDEDPHALVDGEFLVAVSALRS